MGIGRLLGGALTGYGAGMVESAKMAEDERRAMALENLRNENDTARMEQQYKLADVNAARSDSRTDMYDARKTGRTVQAEIKVGEATFGRQLTLEQIQHNNRLAVEAVQSTYRMNEQQASQMRTAAIEAQQQGTFIKDFVTNSEGMLVGLTATGRQVTTNVKPQPKAEDGDGSILTRAGRPPITAPTPAAKAAPSVAKVKTITRAQVAEAASKQGMTVAQATKWAQSNGFTVK